ncbi:MAG: 50S ribosomal protein L24 [Gammaproteobacteria bacterium RIFCSPHIGHO2_02_FULL_42_13]|nr:MAG: 50S ribosomal protein L24 [Gammaproteobacteria bacterium RIFCSPHIGHO2_02_FULL_42_13]OGT68459.1 MAG: 50S ribosomal protein L24 [Gammaproteobacteria bacterium RIFCSPLOWO2_02_FULL_42_9]
MKSKIKTNDEVVVIAGKDKGKRGAVKSVKRSKKGQTRCLVDGVNIVKKHVKPNPQAGQPGGIQDREAFIDASNVMIFNSETNKKDRVAYKILKDGKKVRCYKSTGEVIDKN